MEYAPPVVGLYFIDGKFNDERSLAAFLNSGLEYKFALPTVVFVQRKCAVIDVCM